MDKISAIIQARLGSKRFPKKILKKVSDKTILEHVIDQVQNSKLIDEIIIATTDLKQDHAITEICKKNKIKFFIRNISRIYIFHNMINIKKNHTII